VSRHFDAIIMGPARQARLWLRGLRPRVWRSPLLNATSLVAHV